MKSPHPGCWELSHAARVFKKIASKAQTLKDSLVLYRQIGGKISLWNLPNMAGSIQPRLSLTFHASLEILRARKLWSRWTYNLRQKKWSRRCSFCWVKEKHIRKSFFLLYDRMEESTFHALHTNSKRLKLFSINYH